jgi:AcrR family transcriptional regulator
MSAAARVAEIVFEPRMAGLLFALLSALIKTVQSVFVKMTYRANPEILKPMPKRSDAYMEKRRSQILDAAITCISDQGWNRTTIDSVAAAAGLSKGALYVHFANKRALLVGLLERNIEEIEANASIDSFETLRANLTSGTELLASPRGWSLTAGHLEVVIEGVRDPEIRAMFNRANARLLEIFSGIVARLRPDLSTAAARTQALCLIMVIDGMRSVRATSEGLSKNAFRAVLDQMLLPLNPATKSKR